MRPIQLQYEIDRKEIGKRLRTERLRTGYTQENLSEAIGVTSKYLSKMENGAAAPSLPFIMKFSEVTGSDLNYLLRGTGKTSGEQRRQFGESSSVYEEHSHRMSKKSRRICDEVVRKLAEVLEENNI